MSSYLFVLAAGEYDRIATTVEGVDIGVVVPGHQLREQGRYALGVAARTLAYFNDYFGVKYPLPKLDNILVPRNFTGAMENWGGVIYSERALLFDEAIGSADDRKVVHEYVVHELAHQWFGNLVTMKWWDELWLNEGFASWMEKKLTDEFNPSMKVWVRTRADKEKAMAKDALRTAHPVQQPIDDESEALAAFDDITYLKGLSLVRMLEAYVGETPFRDGLRRYMAKHAYSNATSADLWAALEAASNKPIAAIATWLQSAARNSADPCVHTMRGQQARGDAQAGSLRRSTILMRRRRPGRCRSRSAGPATTGHRAWNWWTARARTLTFDGCDRPVKANYGDVGYYRVQLRRGWPESVGGGLSSTKRRRSGQPDGRCLGHGVGRAQPSGRLSRTYAKLSDETELAVWDSVIENLRFIDDQYAASPQREAFRAYARSCSGRRSVVWDGSHSLARTPKPRCCAVA